MRHVLLCSIVASLALCADSSFSQSSWFWQNPSPTGQILNAVSSPDTNTVVAVGTFGTLLRSTDGGLTSIKGAPLPGTAIPAHVALMQNYPNPFNPSTTIRYSLPHRTRVTLGVFNILGQQVALLQNGDQDAGFHEVRFDGSGLASGVYFYRIQAGDFVQTKKLALVK